MIQIKTDARGLELLSLIETVRSESEMGIFSKTLLRRRVRTASDEGRRIREAVARVLAMNPGLRHVPHCDELLSRTLKASLQYTDNLVASLPPACVADADAWIFRSRNSGILRDARRSDSNV